LGGAIVGKAEQGDKENKNEQSLSCCKACSSVPVNHGFFRVSKKSLHRFQIRVRINDVLSGIYPGNSMKKATLEGENCFE